MILTISFAGQAQKLANSQTMSSKDYAVQQAKYKLSNATEHLEVWTYFMKIQLNNVMLKIFKWIFLSILNWSIFQKKSNWIFKE